MNRNKRERDRLRAKRADPAYRQRENAANKLRMRKRRGNRDTAYVRLERAMGWWQA